MARLRRLLAIAIAALPAAAGVARADAGPVFPSAEAVVPLAVGSAVPAAPLRDIDGEPTALAALLRGRGALLVFYRGGW